MLDDQVDSHVPRFASAESDSEDANVAVIQTVTKDTTSTGGHPAPAIPMPLPKIMKQEMPAPLKKMETAAFHPAPVMHTATLHPAPVMHTATFHPAPVMRTATSHPLSSPVWHKPSPTFKAEPDMHPTVVPKEEKFMKVPMMGGPGSIPPAPIRKM